MIGTTFCAGAVVCMIGIGNDVQYDIMWRMASHPTKKYSFYVESYLKLDGILKKVKWRICGVMSREKGRGKEVGVRKK